MSAIVAKFPVFAIFGVLIASALALLVGICTGFQLMVIALAAGACCLFARKLCGPAITIITESVIILAGLAVMVGLLELFGISPLLLLVGFILLMIIFHR